MKPVDSMIAAIVSGFAETAPRTGIDRPDPRVLNAMRSVPRDRFVPPDQRPYAWDDRALDIGYGQTISQPFVVALTTQLSDVELGTRVLEIGTGSGYQAAVLAALGAEVWSIELDEDLARDAKARFAELRIRVQVRIGDGSLGWPEEAPFARIVATASPALLPPAWLAQLLAPGRLVTPLGPVGGIQVLSVFDKDEDGRVERTDVLPVRFVPLRH